MAETLGSGTERQELVNVIRQVRKRWRMKLLLRGGVIFVAGSLLALVLASLGLQTYKFSPGSILALRIVTLSVFALLLVGWLLVPLRRRVTDLQVALYVEEHEPSLQAAILSAVDLGAVSPEGHQRRRAAGHRREAGLAGGGARPDDRRRQVGRPPWFTAARPRPRVPGGSYRASPRRRSRVPAPGRVGAARAREESRGRQSLRHCRQAGRRDDSEGVRPVGLGEAQLGSDRAKWR